MMSGSKWTLDDTHLQRLQGGLAQGAVGHAQEARQLHEHGVQDGGQVQGPGGPCQPCKTLGGRQPRHLVLQALQHELYLMQNQKLREQYMEAAETLLAATTLSPLGHQV